MNLTDTHAPLRQTLDVLRERRRLLKLFGVWAAAGMLLPRPSLACTLIPSETAGPYPGDGTNGPNVLTQSGILRSDLRSSFGASGSASAAGTPLSVTLRLASTTTGCQSLEGLAVYLWHCDALGRYSMYSSGVTAQNYLRGVQVSDARGEVRFTTIFPGAYSGRWPHIHFEVYADAAAAVSGRNALRTSQLALPSAACMQVYQQTQLYPGSLSNYNGTTLGSDNVFGDDQAANQLATTTGDNTSGYAATLEVGIALAPTTGSSLFGNGFEA